MRQETLDFVAMVQRAVPGAGAESWNQIDGPGWREQVERAFFSIRHGGSLWLASETVDVADLVGDLRWRSDWERIIGQAFSAGGSCVCALGNGTGMHAPAVSVVVPTVQTTYLPRFMATHRSLERGEVEYVVVSNGTEESDLGRLLSLPFDVLVHYPQPLGFPAACNAGARLTRERAEVLVLANDDTEMLLPGWDVRLWEIVDGERDLGALAPVLSSIGNRYQLAGALPIPDLYDAPVLFYGWVAFPRAVWRDVGALDEAFGMGNGEDIDHSLRIRESGRRLVVDPLTSLYHRTHGTFSLMTPEQFNGALAHAAVTLRAKWGDRLAELAPEVAAWVKQAVQDG